MKIVILLMVLVSTVAFASVDDSYTKSLLEFDGLPGSSTTYIDESGRFWAPSWAEISTVDKKIGDGSLYLPAGCQITSIYNSDWDLGTGDFTIDFWAKYVGAPSSFAIVAQGAGYSGWFIQFSNYPYIRLWVNGTAYGARVYTNPNDWHHFAIIRSGSDLYYAIDGIIANMESGFTENMSFGSELIIGDSGSGSACNVDEFRLSKGIARWTSDFTLATAPYSISTPPEPPPATPTAMVCYKKLYFGQVK